MSQSVFVTDFDGTMTENDFYKLSTSRLLSATSLYYWDEYRAGRMTHFAALQRIFGQLRAPEQDVLALLQDMRPDPGLLQSVTRLAKAGWRIVVASAGCAWYIERILADVGLRTGPGQDVEVHANPGFYDVRTGLRMELPADSAFCCVETGVDKAAIVRHYQQAGCPVAYAGDGLADLDAAMLVAPELRFAREDLQNALLARGQAFRHFACWSEVAETLLEFTAKHDVALF